jgi:signal transduction histidine kinase
VAFATSDRWFRRPSSPLALAALAVAFGLLTLSRARHDPGGSFAGQSTLGAIAELAGGWSVIAAGTVFWTRHRGNLFGPLLISAGFAWFLPEWTNPGAGSAVGFTAGLLGAAACPPLVGHAALSYPTGRLRSRLEQLTMATAYAGGLVLLGVLPTAVFDARGEGCFQCSRNLALVAGNTGLYRAFEHYGLRIGIVWVGALGLLLLWRLLRSWQAGNLLLAPVVLPATAFLTLVLWDYRHSFGRDLIANDTIDIRIWRFEALSLSLLGLGVSLRLARERRARGAVARLVVELGNAASPGALSEMLASALGDPTLILAYRRAEGDEGDEYVSAAGLPVRLPGGPSQILTPIRRGRTEVGVLVHSARLGEEPGLVEGVVSAARLALQNEQLQAEVRAQLRDLRASRARLVEAADSERRRLEHDLHDGAQQRIVALSLALQLLRSQLGHQPDREQEAQIAAAQAKLQQSLTELRELAHGIYPAALSEEGLAAALEGLVEQADAPLRLEAVPEGRFPSIVENAAYFTIVEAIDQMESASLRLEHQEDRLVIRIRGSGNGAPGDWTQIADRVGALDGRLETNEGEIRVEIPCGS